MNFSGMVAANVLRGDMPVSHWDDLGDGMILDVREPVELEVESVEGAVNIPLGQLRARLDELPRDEPIHVICRSGQRAHYAVRMLLQQGFDARNVSGGRAVESVFVVLLAGGAGGSNVTDASITRYARVDEPWTRVTRANGQMPCQCIPRTCSSRRNP